MCACALLAHAARRACRVGCISTRDWEKVRARDRAARKQRRKYAPRYNTVLQPALGGFLPGLEGDGGERRGERRMERGPRRRKVPLISLKKDYFCPVCGDSLIGSAIQFLAIALLWPSRDKVSSRRGPPRGVNVASTVFHFRCCKEKEIALFFFLLNCCDNSALIVDVSPVHSVIARAIA